MFKMLELIALAGLLIAGLAVACVVGVVFLVFKVVFWAGISCRSASSSS